MVVIDVLRACSTIIHALSQGCRAIYPVATVREAWRKAEELGGDRVVLGGERKGLRIKGFQLGNSPLEYSSRAVRDKTVVFTTTNCTKTLSALKRPREVILCSFLNLPAVRGYLLRQTKLVASAGGGSRPRRVCKQLQGRPQATASGGEGEGGKLLLALSGTGGELALEDVVCAGMLIHRLVGAYCNTPLLSDSARLAYITYLHYKDDPRKALFDSAHGRRLIELGMGKDLDFCAQVGRYDIIPRLQKGRLSL